MTASAPLSLTASVIVPTYNRRERLCRLLLALDRAFHDGTRFEVVLVVDGATDGTVEMLDRFESAYPLRVHVQANGGPAAARNRALAMAEGEVLLFLDDDVVPAPGHLAAHLAAHARDERLVCMGPMVPPPGARMPPWLRWEALKLHKQYDAMLTGAWAPTPRQFYTANASVRRAHALAAGGFDERFTRAEDVEFAYRLADRGLRFAFLPHAAVLHEPDRTLTSWLRVAHAYGRHDVLMQRIAGREHVRFAISEERLRHPLNRALPRWCVGHPARQRVARAALSSLLRLPGAGPLHRAQMAACSALWNLQYWQGIADATGLGAAIWRGIPGDALAPPTTPDMTDAAAIAG